MNSPFKFRRRSRRRPSALIPLLLSVFQPFGISACQRVSLSAFPSFLSRRAPKPGAKKGQIVPNRAMPTAPQHFSISPHRPLPSAF